MFGESIISKFGEEFAKELVKKGWQIIADQWNEFNWETAEQGYVERMQKIYGTVPILGGHKPMDLEGIFTDLYLLDKPSAYCRYDIENLREDESILKNAKRNNGLDIVKNIKNNRLFILGKPGAGKTTFLKYVVLQTIQQHLLKVPIFVGLKEWFDSSLNLMEFIVKQFEICCFPDAKLFIETILKKGEAIVLFDGLDEVNQADAKAYEKLIQTLKDFSNQYFNSQILITCRIASVNYSFNDYFTYVEVADFTKEQQTAFVDKWFKEDDDKKKRFFEGFQQDAQQGLRDLGRIPLLLSLICLNFEETQQFPHRRSEIYDEALNALLSKWNASKNIHYHNVYKALSLGRKRQLLAKLAATNFEKNQQFFKHIELANDVEQFFKQLPPAENTETIEGLVVLKAMESQHGLLIERAKDIYAFSHLTFQEYFTARYIIENQRQINLLEHIEDQRWREVFLLTAEMLSTESADKFFNLFINQLNKIWLDDPEIIEFLQWADSKAQLATNNSYTLVTCRFFYIFIVLAFILVSNRAFVLNYTIPLSIALNSNHALDRILTCALTFDRTLSHALAFDRAYSFAFDLDHIHNFDLARTLDKLLGIDYLLHMGLTMVKILHYFPTESYSKFREYIPTVNTFFEETIKFCTEHHEVVIANILKHFTISTEGKQQDDWKIIEEQLKNILQNERNMKYNWNLTEKQFNKIELYFKGAELFMSCLKVASVSQRDVLENRLFEYQETPA